MDPFTEELENLEKNLEPYKKLMQKTTEVILDQEVSSYPVFVAHQEDSVEIGILLYEKEEPGHWTIHASSLEELVARQVISEEKVENFKQVYKDPKEFACVFVVRKIGATFAFLPLK